MCPDNSRIIKYPYSNDVQLIIKIFPVIIITGCPDSYRYIGTGDRDKYEVNWCNDLENQKDQMKKIFVSNGVC